MKMILSVALGALVFLSVVAIKWHYAPGFLTEGASYMLAFMLAILATIIIAVS